MNTILIFMQKIMVHSPDKEKKNQSQKQKTNSKQL